MHPPKRPPLRNVYCIYGINEPTEIGYHYKATEDGPVLKKWLWEGDGGELYSTSFTAIKSQSLGFSEFLKSGDGSVPYTSLSWCNAWHLGEPEITHTQTTFEDGNTRLPLFRRMIGTQTQVFGQGRYGRLQLRLLLVFKRDSHHGHAYTHTQIRISARWPANDRRRARKDQPSPCDSLAEVARDSGRRAPKAQAILQRDRRVGG